MKLRELIGHLSSFHPDSRVVISVRGHHLHPHVGVGLDSHKDPTVVVADRSCFPGQIPDLFLKTNPTSACCPECGRKSSK